MMKSLELTSSSSLANWLIFLAVIVTVGLAIAGYFFWILGLRGAGGKRHRKHHKRRRHQRQRNPTLAELGGLPPKRDDGQPPAGL